MKLFLLTLLATFSLASTDILPPSESANELTLIFTDNYECNLHLERAGQDLVALAKAEEASNTTALKQAFNNFMNHSNLAIDACYPINEAITLDIIEVQANIAYYYYQNYR